MIKNIHEKTLNEQIEEQDKRAVNKNIHLWIAIILVAILCISVWAYTSLMGKIPENKQVDYIPTTISLSTYTDKLEYAPTYISTDLGEYTATFNIDLSDSIVLALENSIGRSYIKYSNEDSSIETEIIITDTIPINLGFKEDITVALNKNKGLFIQTEDTEGKSTERAITKLFDIGYLVVIQTTGKTETSTAETTTSNQDTPSQMFTTNMLDTIKECMLYSNNKESNNANRKLFIEIEGLGTFDFNTLSVFKNNAAVSTENNTFKIYNGKDCIAFGEYEETLKMVQVDEWQNLYRESNSGNLGIQTNKGFYRIETTSEQIESELISLLGIQKDDTKVQIMFE